MSGKIDQASLLEVQKIYEEIADFYDRLHNEFFQKLQEPDELNRDKLQGNPLFIRESEELKKSKDNFKTAYAKLGGNRDITHLGEMINHLGSLISHLNGMISIADQLQANTMKVTLEKYRTPFTERFERLNGLM